MMTVQCAFGKIIEVTSYQVPGDKRLY